MPDRWLHIKKIVMAALLVAVPLSPSIIMAQGGKPSVLTPSEKYSDPAWKQKATKYSPRLNDIYKAHVKKYKQDQIHFLTTAESSVGGIGFWPSPVNYGDPSRYLSVMARVRCPEPCTGRAFPDTQTGRIMTVMDAFGKFTIGELAKQLKEINDPAIKGAAIIFIYDRKAVTAPDFESNAEAFALFIPKDAVIKFAELRMTIQSLFSQSQMLPVFKGGEQIKNLRLYIIQP